MAAASDYLENKILNHLLRATALTAPTIYVSLHTGDPADTGANELAGGGYQRVAVPNWNAAGSRATANTDDILFPVMQAAVGSVSYFGAWDALSGGNFLFRTTSALGTALATARGTAIKITAGAFAIGLTGEISTYAANKMLDLIFRGTAFPTPTPYASLHTADPGLTGANEVSGNGYARVAVSTWDSPSGGATANTNQIDFSAPTPSSYGTIPYKGLFDAASGGNFLISANLDSPLITVTDQAPADEAGDFDVVVQ